MRNSFHQKVAPLLLYVMDVLEQIETYRGSYGDMLVHRAPIVLTLQTAHIPEPASFGLLGLGAAALFRRTRTSH